MCPNSIYCGLKGVPYMGTWVHGPLGSVVTSDPAACDGGSAVRNQLQTSQQIQASGSALAGPWICRGIRIC